MHPEFGIIREQKNLLYVDTYRNVSGKFHFHSQIELMFVDEGEVDVFVNDTQKVLKAGEMSVALSYDAHVYRSVGDSSVTILYVPTYLCEEFILSVKNKRASNHFICDLRVVEEIRSCLEKIQKARAAQNDMVVMGYIYVMLGVLMEHIDLERAPAPIDTALSSQLLFYINENYKNDVTLTSLASYFGYNPSYISRYFRSCFNIGINQYITAVRLKNVVMLLRENKYNVTYCALESGFNSMRSFYRAFFNEFHCSPKEYMEQIKGQ